MPCKFSHPPTFPQELCWFHFKGPKGCSFGIKCRKSHKVPDGVCYFFLKEQCKHMVDEKPVAKPDSDNTIWCDDCESDMDVCRLHVAHEETGGRVCDVCCEDCKKHWQEAGRFDEFDDAE